MIFRQILLSFCLHDKHATSKCHLWLLSHLLWVATPPDFVPTRSALRLGLNPGPGLAALQGYSRLPHQPSRASTLKPQSQLFPLWPHPMWAPISFSSWENFPDVRENMSAEQFLPLTGDQHPRFRKTWAPDIATALRSLPFPLFFSALVLFFFFFF